MVGHGKKNEKRGNGKISKWRTIVVETNGMCLFVMLFLRFDTFLTRESP